MKKISGYTFSRVSVLYGMSVSFLFASLLYFTPAASTPAYAQSFIGPGSSPPNNSSALLVSSSTRALGFGTSTVYSTLSSLLFKTSGGANQHILFFPNGNVGIGTTTPGEKLEVVGNVKATSFVGGLSGSLSAANVTSDVFGRLQGNGNFSFPASLGVATSTQNGLPQSLSVYGGMYVSGSVGIGITAPTEALTLNGGDIDFTRGDTSAIHSVGEISFDWSAGSYDNPANHGIQSRDEGGTLADSLRINSYSDIINTIDSNANSTSYFKVQKESTTNGTDLFVIDESGNVGVGTSPSSFGTTTGSITFGHNGYLATETTGGTVRRIAYMNGDNHLILGTQPFDPGGGMPSQQGPPTDIYGSGTSISINGGVGIGTTSPAYMLDVQGGQVNVSGGLCIAGDCKTAWNQVASQWTTSGNKIYNNNSGNVGIGTAGPSEKLIVNSTFGLQDDDMLTHAETGIAAPNIYGKAAPITPIGSGGLDLYGISSGRSFPFVAPAGTALRLTGMQYDAQPTEPAVVIRGAKGPIGTGDLAMLQPLLTIQNDTHDLVTVLGGGNVGIGVTAPGAKLVVSGTGAFNTAGSPRLDLYNTAAARGFAMHVGDTGSWQLSDTTGVTKISVGTDYSGQIDFYNGVGNVVFNGSGSVGIGVTAPGGKLEIAAGVVPTLVLGNTSAGAIKFVGASPATITQSAANNDLFIKTTTGTGRITFGTNCGPSCTRMIIDSGGNVGIGTSPAYKLDVASGWVNSVSGYKTNGADYAEFFENEERIPTGSIVGINTSTGKARKYQAGDVYIGIATEGHGFIGNNSAENENDPNYTLVGLVGQLNFDGSQVQMEGRIVKTLDGKEIGILLSNNRVLIGK